MGTVGARSKPIRETTKRSLLRNGIEPAIPPKVEETIMSVLAQEPGDRRSDVRTADRNTELDDGATVMFVRPTSASLESEATAMWTAQSLAHPRSDETEVLDAPGSPPTSRLGLHEASPSPSVAASPDPTDLLVLPTQGPLPQAHGPSPDSARPSVRANVPPPTPIHTPSTPSTPVSPPLTVQVGLLIVVAMVAVAGIGVLVGLLLAGRSPTAM